MVGKNKSEVARISAIDCFKGEFVIDTLVQLTQPVTDWRTRFSRIMKKAMAAAVDDGRVLKGWPEARAELWEYIDANTVLVGQAIHHDLDALRMQHWPVVDSAILAKDAVGPGVNRQWGLKVLCDQLLNIKIQNGSNGGHDSVEDAFAAREVALLRISQPNELEMWATKRKEKCFKKMQALKVKRGTKLQRKSPSSLYLGKCTDDEDDEIERWEDIAEACGWPHPDTGYDPWSD